MSNPLSLAVPDPQTGCKIFLGAHQSKGYGQVWVDGRKMLAHRYAWELANGRPLAPGMQALHHCDVPPCVEPTHIYEGTPAQNTADMMRRGRNRCGRVRGEAHGRSILTEDQARAIKNDPRIHQRGGQRVLAAEYAVSVDMVHKIACGKNWAWL